MTKYTDIEIQTAKNLLENGYMWIVRNETGRLFAHFAKPSKVNNIWCSVGLISCVCNYVPIFQNVRFGDKEPTSIESIVHPPILDDAERRYLSSVIRPFRDSIKYVSRQNADDKSFIFIRFFDDNDIDMCFPYFKKGTMYKGMEIDRRYKLEELGL